MKKLSTITYPDSTSVTYTYDAANRLTSVTDWASGQASFTYDQAGRLATSTQFNGIVTTFSYDIAGRLTGMSSPIASYQFTLDANGNRTNSLENEPLPPALTPGSTVYDYNAGRNRLLSAGDIDYTYDNEGQLATTGGTVLTFNCDHRLAEINDSGAIHQFSYSANGNRLKVTRDGVETRYIYDPFGNLLAEADSLNQITRKYIYGNGLLAAVTPSGRYCYHFNPTGSTIAVTDTSQAVVNAYAYEPFGQVLAQQEDFPQPFKFVGKYGVIAEPNGLYYMRARYYDPSVGRFISEDPIGFAGGDVNIYAYVSNDPINQIDPLGLLTQSQRNSIISTWAGAGSAIGGMLGFLGGGGTGLLTGPGAPAVAVAGAIGGAAAGGIAGAGIGTYLANMMDNDDRGCKPNKGSRHGGGKSQVDDIAREFGMNDKQRRAFGDYIEAIKSGEGRGGADNFSYSQLRELAKEFMGR